MSEAALARKFDLVKVIGGVVVALVAAGFCAAMYMNRYALAANLERHMDSAEKVHGALQQRIGDHDRDIAVTREALRNIEEDLHWQREQSTAMAHRVGAVVVPPPRHAQEGP